jgi:hypothetical protein
MASSTPRTVSHRAPREVQVQPEGPSISELVSDLTRETSELIRREVELARLEVSEAVARVQTGVSSMAIGGVFAFAGLLVLLAAAAFGLDLVLHTPWLSTLIVGAAAVVLGAILLAVGKSRLTRLTPERSLRSLRRDSELVQDHLPGGNS